MQPSEVAPALTIEGVTKTYGTTRVLDVGRIELLPGEVHGLVGENGSGKSTLVKILAGFHEPDSGGQVHVGGERLSHGDSKSADSLGLRFVHQDLGLVGDLDCVDNLALGPGYHVGRSRHINWGRERHAAREALNRLGYDIDVRRKVSTLEVSERTALALARALSSRSNKAHVLVLDEPTANLPATEVERLFTLLRRVRDSGVAILFISHHFNEIFNLADRVTVLRDGKVVATRPVAEVDEGQLIEMMIGRPLDPVSSPLDEKSLGAPILTVEGLAGAVVAGVSLDVSPGEIVGIAGITGSGREEMARLLGGDLSRRGKVSIHDRVLPSRRPDLLARRGVAYVPADRFANVVLHGHNVRENTTISRLTSFRRGFALSRRRERAEVAGLLDSFDVRPRDQEADISTLSGGNQQKVMLGRAMRLEPKILILDEPTQGVDVGAQAQIHSLVREEARKGTAVIVCSSVSEELAEVADRVLVIAGGRVVKVLHAPLHADQITAATLVTQEIA
jgi:ribose transport system ATP-binding protein